MKILFVHQNFPGQFKYLAPALAQRGHSVVALTMNKATHSGEAGVVVRQYRVARGSAQGVHPWMIDLESKVIRAEACFHEAMTLNREGWAPDLIVAHPGWGESLFLKDVWPQSKVAIYCEYFYHASGRDTGFDTEFYRTEPSDVCRLRLKNLNNTLHAQLADAAISPTQWQADSFPAALRERMAVIHEGVDTRLLRPNSAATLSIRLHGGESVEISRQDEVVTFVNRNLEPYRGFHIFMRALPELLRRRPRARVLIVGGERTGYGAGPDKLQLGAATWKELLVREVRPKLGPGDWSRIHFLGNISYANFVTVLQLSTVHVYLTYPFVLSWSLLEAMSMQCAIVGSDTGPVREVIKDGETGLLVNFFDAQAVVGAVCRLAENADLRARLGRAARRQAISRYDLETVCLPAQIKWAEGILVHGGIRC